MPGKFLHLGEGGFELSILRGGSPIERRCLRTEPHIDSLALGFVSPLVIGTVAFGWVGLASAPRLATLDHAGQQSPFGEVAELGEFWFEFRKALSASIERS